MIKRHLAALRAAPVDVALWNGTFKRAKAVIGSSPLRYELEVDVTHPSLMPYSGRPAVASCLVRWDGGTGHVLGLPTELEGKVQEMIKLATMPEAEAEAVLKDVERALEEFHRDMGFQRSYK